MTNEILWYLCVFSAGIILGLFFYGGLLYTVHIGLKSKQSVWIFVLSMLIRVCAVLAGFWLLTKGQPHYLLFCLAGFFTGRIILNQSAGGKVIKVNSKPEAGKCT